MVNRLIKLNKSNSLFLFGARGTGKTTLLREFLSQHSDVLWIDLLTEKDEESYGRHPDQLIEALNRKKYSCVVIDEIQKAPKLLDTVHKAIEENNIQFLMTGSSARKLKRGAANLLAGRAFQNFLYPLTHLELQNKFDLSFALEWGGLPKLLNLDSIEDKLAYLRTYVRTYLKEEIVAEQIIRKVEPFRDFLEISAQMNGRIINYSKIASEIGVDDKTVRSYFEILEDTLVGFHLMPFHRSIRKRQRESPKFFLFDTGVKRVLDRSLGIELKPGNSSFGEAFEHFIALELFRLNEYYQRDYRFSFLRTKDDAEVDFVIERPGKPDFLLEIKSAPLVKESMIKSLVRFSRDWDKPCLSHLWSLDPTPKKIDTIHCLPWHQGMAELFD